MRVRNLLQGNPSLAFALRLAIVALIAVGWPGSEHAARALHSADFARKASDILRTAHASNATRSPVDARVLGAPLTHGARAEFLRARFPEATPSPTWAGAPIDLTRARSVRTAQGYDYYPYDGSWRFIRIWTNSRGSLGGGGRRRGGGGGGGWAHDYPDADVHFSTILRELTKVRTLELPYGGNVLTFDDPRLFQFPIAYVSEPDEWSVTDSEAQGLRAYIDKGGFVIFDDFFINEMPNLVYQMSYVFPELRFLLLDETDPIWDSFFKVIPSEIYLVGPNKTGTPQFWGLFEDNDKSKRMLALANAGADIGDLWEWSASGFYPVDPTNEAFRIGVNYIIYALTH